MKSLMTISRHLFVFSFFMSIMAGIPVFAEDGATKHVAAVSPDTAQHSNDKIVVYYFHGNMRCRTCKTIEALTREAVLKGFAEKIKNGSMTLQIVNVDKSENSHFVNDYQLVTRSVVVSKMEDGKEKNWKRLDRVWELVRDEPSFVSYVRDEINAVMKGES